MEPEVPNPHHLFLRAYTEHEPSLRAFVQRLVPRRSNADDILQDIAVVLWEKFSAFESGTDFRAWAFRVVGYKVLAGSMNCSCSAGHFPTEKFSSLHEGGTPYR